MRAWPLPVPLPSLSVAPMATKDPSAERLTDEPEKSYAASPSISLPIFKREAGRPVIPLEPLTVALSEANPVRVVMLDASIIPVVKASSVLRAEASIDVSLIVMASLPRPVIVPAVLAS